MRNLLNAIVIMGVFSLFVYTSVWVLSHVQDASGNYAEYIIEQERSK